MQLRNVTCENNIVEPIISNPTSSGVAWSETECDDEYDLYKVKNVSSRTEYSDGFFSSLRESM